MAKHTVMDLKKVPIKSAGLEIVSPPDLKFKVVVTLDKKIAAAASKDPLLHQEFQSQASEILDQTKKTIEQKCKVFDKQFVAAINKGASDKDMKKRIKGLNDSIVQDMKVAEKAAELGVQAAWKDLQSKRKEWRGFKIKVGTSIAGTLAGLIVSITAMATSPFSGGAGAVFGIAGLIKSGITLAKEVGKLAVDIETANTLAKNSIKFVEATAKKKGLYATNEVAAALLNQFIGIAQPSIKSAQEAAETLKATHAKMVVKVHDLSKKLNQILKEQGKVKKEFMSEVNKKLKKHPIKDKAAQAKLIEKNLDKVLASNYAKVDQQINKITIMYSETRSWAKPVKDLAGRAKNLDLKDSKGLKVFREVIKLASVSTGAIDGNAIATSAKDLGMGLGEAAGGYVYDKIVSKALDGTIFDAA